MRWIGIAFVLSTSVCFAKDCSDARLQQAVIGGDTIDGSVRLHQKPLRFAKASLFFSNGKTAWVGTTDKDGGIHIKNLRPDRYRLEVLGWGRTTIIIQPQLDKLSNGQTFSYSVQLMDNECIGTISMTD